MTVRRRSSIPAAWLVAALAGAACAAPPAAETQVPANPLALERIPGATPRNIVLIVSDDHRYDAMSFMGHPFIETPNLDRIARAGVHVRNAMVTTALCSPSRASILTGLYAHRHRVVDNNNPVPDALVFFPQHLQAAGYQTAFVGKWHMGGESDAPQRGFDHWVSFQGQGSYRPSPAGLNVNGKKVPQQGYITDELTDYALEWLRGRDRQRPFLLYLSHKAVHAEFIPAERHRGRYASAAVPVPPSQDPRAGGDGRPMWVTNQRNSWHGVDYPYHSRLNVADYYRQYGETLLALDESVGRVLDALGNEGVLDSTVIVYLGDNGFGFGEHGLIDKRTAYEWSIRVPMVAQAPGLIPAGTAVDQVAANIDIAPTLLEAAGLRAPDGLDGRSLLPLLRGDENVAWRDSLLYEYYWERTFPHTPTIHALREARYKYIRYHGRWDVDELYDLQEDPHELRNLFPDPANRDLVRRMNARLFEILRDTNGLSIPLYPDVDFSANRRRRGGSPAADFPSFLIDP